MRRYYGEEGNLWPAAILFIVIVVSAVLSLGYLVVDWWVRSGITE